MSNGITFVTADNICILCTHHGNFIKIHKLLGILTVLIPWKAIPLMMTSPRKETIKRPNATYPATEKSYAMAEGNVLKHGRTITQNCSKKVDKKVTTDVEDHLCAKHAA